MGVSTRGGNLYSGCKLGCMFLECIFGEVYIREGGGEGGGGGGGGGVNRLSQYFYPEKEIFIFFRLSKQKF